MPRDPVVYSNEFSAADSGGEPNPEIFEGKVEPGSGH
jgi:hypothetical protein